MKALGSSQVLLDEPRAEVDIDLDQGDITDAAEAVDLTGLDDEDVTGACFKLFAVDGPETTNWYVTEAREALGRLDRLFPSTLAGSAAAGACPVDADAGP